MQGRRQADASAVRTFLIADVRGYTQFTVAFGDAAAAGLTERFGTLTREVCLVGGGRILAQRGDESVICFTSARQAIRAAVRLQDVFRAERESGGEVQLHVGIGLDAGEAIRSGRDFRGAALNLAARLCSIAAPGEILASQTVINLARKVDGVSYEERGSATLKGFPEAVPIIRISRDSSPEEEAITDRQDASTTWGLTQNLPMGGYLGALPEGILVGRGDELDRVNGLLDEALSQSGNTILISGEPGVGKTRLGQEATAAARRRGFIIGPGSCREDDQTVPYYPFLEALSALFRAGPAQLRTRVAGDWSPLGRLLPVAEVSDSNNVPSQNGQFDRQRLLWATSDFLIELSRVVPVLLLIDDLHWADASSLELLAHLAQHTRTARVLILGTYRHTDVGPMQSLSGVIGGLLQRRVVERLRLKRLDRASTAQLVASIAGHELPSEIVSTVYDQTDGNAFFVQEVTRELVRSGSLDRSGHDYGEMLRASESLWALIGQRLSRLSPSTQEAVVQASVLGTDFRFDDLLAMTQWAESDLEARLGEAVDSGLLRESHETPNDTFAFRHALTRQAIYERIPRRQKRRLHVTAGEAIEQCEAERGGDRSAEMAQHFFEGDELQRALNFSLKAAETATRLFAGSEAAENYRRALEASLELGDHLHERAALEGLGRSLLAAGRFEDAISFLEQAYQKFVASGDREGAWRVAASLGDALLKHGSARRSIGLLQDEAATIPPDTLSPAAGLLFAALGAALDQTGQIAGHLEAADRAIDIASELRDPALLCRAIGERGRALTRLGRMEEATEAHERAIVLARECGDLQTLQRNLEYARGAHYLRGNVKRAAEHNREAQAIATHLGGPAAAAAHILFAAQEAYDAGRWEECRQLARSVYELPGPAESDRIHSLAELILSIIDMREGMGDPRTTMVSILERAEESMDIGLRRPALAALSELDLSEGRADDVVRYVTPEIGTGDPGRQIELGIQLARAKLQLSAPQEALDMLRSLPPAAGLSACRRKMVEGMAVGALGQIEEAEALLLDAVECSRARSARLAEAMALEQLGRILRAGRQGDAFSCFQRAAAIYEELGARSGLTAVSTELDSLGSRPLVP